MQLKCVLAYPDKYLLIFKYYLETIWIPDHFEKYLTERDPEGVFALKERISKLLSAKKQVLKTTILRGVIENFLPEGK